MTNIFERANGAQPGNKRIAKTLNLRTACDDAIAAVHESVHGTNRTNGADLIMSVDRGRPEVPAYNQECRD
jgi:hypothetical protein